MTGVRGEPWQSNAALVVEGLARTLPGGRQLFIGLELEVAAGEIIAIVGESGVGKSTLLNILAGLDDNDAGSVRIGGIALSGLDETGRTRLRREAIGFVFQAFQVLPYLTLRQNVALPLALVSADRLTIEARADRMLAAVGLGDRARAMPAISPAANSSALQLPGRLSTSLH